jgi:hypothetical protein
MFLEVSILKYHVITFAKSENKSEMQRKIFASFKCQGII